MLLVQCFLQGLFISLAGSLPLGNLNLTALEFAVHGHPRKAWLFSLGVVFIEAIYLIITIALVDQILAHRYIFSSLQWLTVVLFTVLAIGSFRAGWLQQPRANAVTNHKMPSWLLGMLLSGLNPLQFPFWAGWLIYLSAKGQRFASLWPDGLFVAGAGIGTFLALAVFIVAGRLVAPFLRQRYRAVQYTLGCLFLAMAMLQLTKIA